MRKIVYSVILFFFSILSYSQEGEYCEFNVAFSLKTPEGKTIRKLKKVQVGKYSKLLAYSYKNKIHHFKLTKKKYCNYKLILERRGKKCEIQFYNTKSFPQEVSMESIILKDTTLQFYDGYRSRITTKIRDEMPKMVIIQPSKMDTSQSLLFENYGGFDSVSVTLVTNKIGVHTYPKSTNYFFKTKLNWEIQQGLGFYTIKENKHDSISDIVEKSYTESETGKVYRLKIPQLNSRLEQLVAYFGLVEVKLADYIGFQSLVSFAEQHGLKLYTPPFSKRGRFTLLFENEELIDNYKLLKESRLFKKVEPVFSHAGNGYREYKKKLIRVDANFDISTQISEIKIDSVLFYITVMRDGPSVNIGERRYVVTKDQLIWYTHGRYANQAVLRQKGSNSLFNELKFLRRELPKSYLEKEGEFGDCFVPLNSTSSYNCLTIIIYKNDGGQLMLRGNDLPRELAGYYFKAYHILVKPN